MKLEVGIRSNEIKIQTIFTCNPLSIWNVFSFVLEADPTRDPFESLHGPNIYSQDYINQQPGVLTLEELLKSVEKSYPLVLAAEKLLSEAEYNYLAAEGAFDLQFKSMGTTKPMGYYTNNAADAMFEKPTPLGGTSFCWLSHWSGNLSGL